MIYRTFLVFICFRLILIFLHKQRMNDQNGFLPSDGDAHVVKVYLASGSYNNVRFNDLTTIQVRIFLILTIFLIFVFLVCISNSSFQKIITVVVGRFGGADADLRHYALRILETPVDGRPKESIWLHRELQMKQVVARHGAFFSPTKPSADTYRWPIFWSLSPALLKFLFCRLELRVRYLSKNLEEMYHTQKATFYYFYDQVRKISACRFLFISVFYLDRCGRITYNKSHQRSILKLRLNSDVSRSGKTIFSLGVPQDELVPLSGDF